MKILISGAGIAGCTAAYWLAQAGHKVTVVDRSVGQRSSGAPVDVRGHAIPVAEAMGIMPALRAAATRVAGMKFVQVDRAGQHEVRIDTSAFQRATQSREVELARGALAQIVANCVPSAVEIRYGDGIVQLAQDTAGVDVGFEHAAPQRFDIVIGADGLHSAVRKLAFAAETTSVRHMGLYVATLPITQIGVESDVTLFNAPGRLVALHPCRERPMAAFIFHRAEIADFDHRDREQHKRVTCDAYAKDEWLVPALLEQLRASNDLYFDAVSRVQLPRWSNGRVALVGDAASCISLFGNGSSHALAGGYALAKELNATSNVADAFARYEAQHRFQLGSQHREMSRGVNLLIPKTQFGISLRNTSLQLWPLLITATRIAKSLGNFGARLSRRSA